MATASPAAASLTATTRGATTAAPAGSAPTTKRYPDTGAALLSSVGASAPLHPRADCIDPPGPSPSWRVVPFRPPSAGSHRNFRLPARRELQPFDESSE